MQSEELQRVVNRLWTVQDLMDKFGVTVMTIHNWRRRQHQPLPTVEIVGTSRPAIRFVRDDVKRWARANKISMYM